MCLPQGDLPLKPQATASVAAPAPQPLFDLDCPDRECDDNDDGCHDTDRIQNHHRDLLGHLRLFFWILF
jgi:hypothetical protein